MIRFLETIDLELSKIDDNGDVIDGQEMSYSFRKGDEVPGIILLIPGDENGCHRVHVFNDYMAILAPGIVEDPYALPKVPFDSALTAHERYTVKNT